ncbi:cobaltochelatase subunit CobN [Brucella pseudogrignonensis]|uniref:Cobaltochelatase subunit CobN n=1 Tax=Brucella pseudogrignonensis TaxID=419475 RepID=A0ABU1M3Q9_9HYPH|nr:cobaltochelatase subunit CobN [Brucella pseudogrignonensis]MDR6430674.1 cobaltochelatase CobN [Brucella pseudogrignonensis]
MHLLLAQKGTISDGNEAVDLGQTPGDILFLSAADTELASLAQARKLGQSGPSLRHSVRLANFLNLTHPMSVDAYIERTAKHAKLIVVRIIGGETYWPYGLEALNACAVSHGIKIAVLPGDDKPDYGLTRFSTVSAQERDALWQYLIEGGAANTSRFLDYCCALIDDSEKPEEAAPLLKAGLWWPNMAAPSLDLIRQQWKVADAPAAAIIFYRALVQSGQTQPVEALISALQAKGLNPVPVFVSSLKDRLSAAVVDGLFEDCQPDIVLNATGFAISSPGAERKPTVLDKRGNMVLQVIFSGTPKATWQASQQGLLARDLAMNVALPEVDGRVLSRAVSFKSAKQFDSTVEANIVTHEPDAGRVAFVAELAANWVRLKRKKPEERRIALILANYPNRDGRLGNGVGLDTPAGTVEVLRAMKGEGYQVGDVPADSEAFMQLLMAGPTNAANDGREVREVISLNQYKTFFKKLPNVIQQEIETRWGSPENDPFFDSELEGFALPLMKLGETIAGIQPARGYNIDPKETYHSPDLVPPHGYIAFYAYLRDVAKIDAIVHMGKHGNLEWLPGKALALSENCYPEAVFGPTPHVYPFIVNDPGEGTQAKRRAGAVIIDHLTPPLTRAESYGPLKDLEALVDEYYEASGVDPRRLLRLKAQILDLVRDIGLDRDAGIHDHDDEDMALQKLDAYLCDLKEMQIRDGLHIFGLAPEGRLLTDLLVALARVPRGIPVALGGLSGEQSLQRAITKDAGLGEGFDPLDCAMADPWTGPKPALLVAASPASWRIAGDTVERIELLAAQFVEGEVELPADWTQTNAVLQSINDHLRPMVTSCGPSEIEGFLSAISGRFVPPGPSGAPTRGRPDVLPTGRNFFSSDSRAVPTPAAWELGRKSAELLITRYTQDHGEWPTSFGLTAWGTSNMRTGGDDIAQALALIGVKPVWDMASRRVTGYEIVPIAKLGRPRVDVTLRISGFFRDAFPEQIALFDKAVRAVAALDEEAEDNPIANRIKVEQARLIATGADAKTAERRAGYRVFGSKPGAYGAGLQALIDENGWAGRNDLAEAWLVWGGYAYGAGEEGQAERGLLEERLRSVQAVVQNQDNREHDLLDSDDYYQFEGGMAATVENLTGAMPTVYHNDHSRPEKPVIRTLEEELARVVRGRAANPKWIAGVMRHGYKGAAEIAATVDYLFAFAATTGKVGNHHFEAVYQAYIADRAVHDFMLEKNPAALSETASKLNDAIERGFWVPRSNSARFELENLMKLNSGA